jgi:5-methylcytosine-specific restriction endonuclease McrA
VSRWSYQHCPSVANAIDRRDRATERRSERRRMRVISTNMTIPLVHLTDEALVAETQRVVDLDRRTTAELLTLLIESERRSLHLTLGYSSLFTYCTRALRLSEQAAFNRITAARAARRYPVILQRLAEGDVTLSSIRILAAHLTDENVDSLLDAARHKSTRDVEQLVAAVQPQPDIPASVRALPSPKGAGTGGAPTHTPGLLDGELIPAPSPTVRVPVSPAAPRPIVAPISPRRYLLRVTVGEETHDKLQRARALLRHAIPNGDLDAILDRALTLLLREAERSRWASVRRPRASRQDSTEVRRVPASVRRAVWTRDAGCCAFVGPHGRCGETGWLEFHHVVPFSAGGKTDEGNLELRCRAHNQHEAVTAGIARPTRRAASW